jgi:hypothetical protein
MEAFKLLFLLFQKKVGNMRIFMFFFFFCVSPYITASDDEIRLPKRKKSHYKMKVQVEPYDIYFSTGSLAKLVFFLSVCNRVNEGTLEEPLCLPLMEFSGPGKIITDKRGKKLLCVGDNGEEVNYKEWKLGACLGFDAKNAIKAVQNSTLFRENFDDSSGLDESSFSSENDVKSNET